MPTMLWLLSSKYRNISFTYFSSFLLSTATSGLVSYCTCVTLLCIDNWTRNSLNRSEHNLESARPLPVVEPEMLTVQKRKSLSLPFSLNYSSTLNVSVDFPKIHFAYPSSYSSKWLLAKIFYHQNSWMRFFGNSSKSSFKIRSDFPDLNIVLQFSQYSD
jgi:hypothetical protein